MTDADTPEAEDPAAAAAALDVEIEHAEHIVERLGVLEETVEVQSEMLALTTRMLAEATGAEDAVDGEVLDATIDGEGPSEEPSDEPAVDEDAEPDADPRGYY